MTETIRLQQAIDNYLQGRQNGESEGVFSRLAQYLVHYSDLFRDQEWEDGADFSEWEAELEEQMVRLLEGDIEPEHDLGTLTLDKFEVGHLRDFIGWYLLRESASSDAIRVHGRELSRWFVFLRDRGYWTEAKYLEFLHALHEAVDEAVRASVLARVLYYYVRSGSAMSPHARGKRFTAFAEGHARVKQVQRSGVVFRFDNRGQDYGPIALPAKVLEYVREGDVFDVELGCRDGQWYIVDIGPVYPGCVYVEAEELTGLDKIS